MFNPLACEHCGQDLPTDDAVAIIEGTCSRCRIHGRANRPRLRATMDDAPPEWVGDCRTSSDQFGSESCAGDKRLSIEPPNSDTAVQTFAASSIHDQIDALHALVPRLQDTSRHKSGSDEPVMAEYQPPAGVARRINPPKPPPPGSLSFPNEEAAPAARVRHRGRRRDLIGGILAGMLLTLSVAGYFISHDTTHERLNLAQSVGDRAMCVRIQPPHARVALDGEPLGPPDEQGRIFFDLSSPGFGDRVLEVSAAGFQTVTQRLSTFAGAPEAFIQLVPAEYRVAISTEPRGAEIWLDGVHQGKSPTMLTVSPESAGSLSVALAGYQTEMQELVRPTNGGDSRLNVVLRRIGPVVAVETEPAGAEILIEGRRYGASPVEAALDPSSWGRDVNVTAVATGFETASLRTRLPAEPQDRTVSARIVLERACAQLAIQTDPPGGRVRIGGRDLGETPTVARFESAEAGREVTIEASLGGAYFAKQRVTVPPIGTVQNVAIALRYCGQRVALISLAESWSAHRLLTDRMLEQIETLQDDQRFAVIASGEEGPRVWPAEPEMSAATSEQKVRAYDEIRSTRPGLNGNLERNLQTALELRPSTIWLFLDKDLDRALLDEFASSLKDQELSVHVVQAESNDSTPWLVDWTSRMRGTLTILRGAEASAVALDADDEMRR